MKTPLFKIIIQAGILLSFFSAAAALSQDQPAPHPGKKEIPQITFKNLSPPFEDYAYFQGVSRYAFQSDATSFNLINAWWLAESSTLVYSGETFVRSRFEAAGLTKVKFFNMYSTQCYVASNEKFAIVAFRGSEIWKKTKTSDSEKTMADLKRNIDIRLSDWQPGGKVHRGFQAALDEVWPDLLPHMRKLHAAGCKIWITGHSLGGALATLCGDRYGSAQGVYTFGSPKVGNQAFKQRLDIRLYRIVNNDDIVPRLLHGGEYVHVGQLKLIDDHGIIRDTGKHIESDAAGSLSGNKTHGRSNPDRPQDHSFEGFVPSGFKDHVPLLYAVHLWNNLVENRHDIGGAHTLDAAVLVGLYRARDFEFSIGRCNRSKTVNETKGHLQP